MAKAKPKSKSEVVNDLADKTGLNKNAVTSVLDALEEMIGEEIGAKGPGSFALPGLLRVERTWKEKVDRMGRNPKTGEAIPIKKPAHYTVKVKVLKGLTDMVASMKKKID